MSMIGTYRLFNAMENATVTSGTLQTLLTTSLQADSEFQAGVVQYGIFERAVASTNIMTAIVGSDAAITYLTSAVEATPSLQLFVGSTTAMTAASTVTYARNAILGSGALSYIMSTGSVVRNANISGFAQYIAPYYVWTSRTSGTTSSITSLTYGNGIYLRGAGDGVFRSFDGVTWTSANLLANTTALLYANNLFLAGNSGGLLTSPDAVSWTNRAGGVNALTYGALYVGAGAAGFIVTSTNGVSWNNPTSGTSSNLNAVTFGANRYVVAGDGGAMRVSTDGTTWQGVGPGVINPFAATIGAGGSQWIAGASGALAFTTTDNLFSSVSSGTTSTIRSIVYAAGQTQQYVYGGVTSPSSGLVFTSTDGISWTQRTVSSTGGTYYVAYGAGETAPYFSVDLNGGVHSSTNAISWVTRTASGGGFVTVTYGGGSFYAAGSSGSSVVSEDGVTLQTLGPRFSQGGLIYDGSLLVSGGNGGVIKTSTDGIIWTTRTSGTNRTLGGGAFGAPMARKYLFVITSGGVATSTDAITWSATNLGFDSNEFGAIGAGASVAYGDGRYLIAGYVNANSNGIAYSSTDGASWSGGSNIATGIPLYAAAASGLGTSAQQYAVAGVSGRILTSTDALSWTTRTTNTTDTFYGIAYGAGKYVAVTNAYRMRTSTDGVSWASPWVLPVSQSMRASAGAGAAGSTNDFVIAGDGGTLFSSVDGVQWVTRTSATSSSIRSLTYSAGETQRFLLTTVGGGLSTSTDGITWTARTSGTTSDLAASAYNSTTTEKYVYAGAGGALRSSTDAVTWTARTSGTTSAINSLAASPTLTEKYVYAGAGGVLRSSTDAVTWTARTSGTTSVILTTIFANNLYVYAGLGGVLSTSTDGITWNARTSNTTSEIRSIAYGGGLYCYAATGGTLATSTDAITWTRRYAPTIINFLRILHNGSQFVAIGESGFMAYSQNGINWSVYDPSYPAVAPWYAIKYVNDRFVSGSATSTDGLSWNNNSAYSLVGQVIASGSQYWAVPYSSGSDLQKSTDGAVWSYTTGGYNTSSNIAALAYVAGPAPLIYGGASGIQVSPDGYAFSGGGFPSTVTGGIRDMVYAGGRYACCYTTSFMAYSEDGLGWTPNNIGSGTAGDIACMATSIGQASAPGTYGYLVMIANGTLFGLRRGVGGGAESITNPITASTPGSLAFGDGQYALVLPFYNSIALSARGLSFTWVTRPLPGSVSSTTNYPRLLAHAPGQTVRWLVAGTSKQIYTSTDTNTWSTVTLGWAGSNNVSAVQYLPGAPQPYIAAGGGGEIATSTDGITWTIRTSPTSTAPIMFAYGSGQYVGALVGSTVLTSTDGATWGTVSSPVGIRTVLFDGTKFVAGQTSGNQSVTSTDGATWLAANGLAYTDATGFAYGAGVYVMTRNSSSPIATSTDGKSWVTRTAGTTSALDTVVYNSSDARFYAYGNNVQVSSTDGITWSAVVGTTGMSGVTSTIRALIYANNTYVYAGDGGVLRTSTDGLSWTARTSGTSSILRSLAYSNGVFLTAGDGGVLRSSTDAITWDAQSSGTTSAINALTYGLGTSIFGGAGGVLGTNT